MRTLSLLLLAGCCRNDEAPTWLPLDPLTLAAGGTGTVDLANHVEDDDPSGLSFEFVGDETLLVAVDGDVLSVTAQPDMTGSASVLLTATDGCGNVSETAELMVTVGTTTETPDAPACATTLSYTAQGSPDAIALAGELNDWSTDTHRLSANGDGTWSLAVELEPGVYPYKFVELTEGLYGDEARWTCDPEAALIQCDEGYKSNEDTSWSQDCTLDATSCNSLLVVSDCRLPTLSLEALSIDREAGAVSARVEVRAGAGGGEIVLPTATLDGASVDAWNGSFFQVDLASLTTGRHVLAFQVTDADGYASAPLRVPFWTDDFDWDRAVLYYAFIDRFADGDPSLNADEGASIEMGSYQGGDWQGLLEMLPYLDDLGVNALWITNPQDNAVGAWDGQCDSTFSAYHGYWPVDTLKLEEHFGDEATLQAVVDAAHARGMRVLVDWVANHVHEDHAYYQDHPDWFGAYAWCEDDDNWNQIPETCWFAPYLPDVDYTNPEALYQMVEDAITLSQTYGLDGLRIDAAKHMPHSVQYNLEARIQAEIEHSAAGGDEEFWTVGETFDNYDRIDSYIDDHQLDGQFDFPLYYILRAALIDETTSLPDLLTAAQDSEARFADARMSTFLGNHDVSRFTTDAESEDTTVCADDGGVLQAEPASDPATYDRLRLGWTFLFTRPGVPLVYNGDELGLPGYNDPDNRQALWTATDDGSLDGVESVENLAAKAEPEAATVLRHVSALAHARAEHPALSGGTEVEWWTETDVVSYARVSGDDAVLVVINRSTSDRTLSNALVFAGLPTSGSYTDLLTGDRFAPSGDSLSVDVGARASRVLAWGP